MELVCEKLGVYEYKNYETLYFKLLEKFKLEFEVTDLYKESKTDSDKPFDHMMKCYKECLVDKNYSIKLSDEVTKGLIQYYLDYYINFPKGYPIHPHPCPSRTDPRGRCRNDPYQFLF